MKLLFVESSELGVCPGHGGAGLDVAWPGQVHRVPDAYEAVDYLTGFRHYADRRRFPFPDAVCLNLKARSRDGLDLLAWLRAGEQFRDLPIVVFGGAGPNTRRCARELAPRAWFTPTADSREVLQFCRELLRGRNQTHQREFNMAE